MVAVAETAWVLERTYGFSDAAIAAAIEPLIDAGLDDDHRRLLAYAVVGMAEGASRRFMEQRTVGGGGAVEEEVTRLAQRMADLAWAGLRSVHAD